MSERRAERGLARCGRRWRRGAAARASLAQEARPCPRAAHFDNSQHLPRSLVAPAAILTLGFGLAARRPDFPHRCAPPSTSAGPQVTVAVLESALGSQGRRAAAPARAARCGRRGLERLRREACAMPCLSLPTSNPGCTGAAMKGSCPYDITARFSDETALKVAGALTGLWALQSLAAPYSAHSAVWSEVGGGASVGCGRGAQVHAAQPVHHLYTRASRRHRTGSGSRAPAGSIPARPAPRSRCPTARRCSAAPAWAPPPWPPLRWRWRACPAAGQQRSCCSRWVR